MDSVDHLCPFACSRCDITCPCDCRRVLLQEYDRGGSLRYREEVCVHELTIPKGTLSIEEVNALTGDDVAYWLSNPFMDPDALAQKVCWWVTKALEAEGASR